MKDLLILGAGPHVGEMVEIVERVNRATPTWNLLGCVAPNNKQLCGGRNGLKVLGLPDCLDKHPQAELAASFDWPRNTPAPMDRLISLIDPSCFVSRTATVGRGCVLYPGCFVGFSARIGDFVFCLSGCAINHDCVLEDRVTLTSRVALAGSVHVEADCYLGQSCTVRQCLRVGRGSLIGMGAVVVDDVPPNSVMAGNPARLLRDRRPNPQ